MVARAPNANNKTFCKLCKVSFNEKDKDMEVHVAGNKHKKRLFNSKKGIDIANLFKFADESRNNVEEPVTGEVAESILQQITRPSVICAKKPGPTADIEIKITRPSVICAKKPGPTADSAAEAALKEDTICIDDDDVQENLGRKARGSEKPATNVDAPEKPATEVDAVTEGNITVPEKEITEPIVVDVEDFGDDDVLIYVKEEIILKKEEVVEFYDNEEVIETASDKTTNEPMLIDDTVEISLDKLDKLVPFVADKERRRSDLWMGAEEPSEYTTIADIGEYLNIKEEEELCDEVVNTVEEHSEYPEIPTWMNGCGYSEEFAANKNGKYTPEGKFLKKNYKALHKIVVRKKVFNCDSSIQITVVREKSLMVYLEKNIPKNASKSKSVNRKKSKSVNSKKVNSKITKSKIRKVNSKKVNSKITKSKIRKANVTSIDQKSKLVALEEIVDEMERLDEEVAGYKKNSGSRTWVL